MSIELAVGLYIVIGLVIGIIVTRVEDSGGGFLAFFAWPLLVPLYLIMRFFMWIEDL
jgi:hypothetical protein